MLKKSILILAKHDDICNRLYSLMQGRFCGIFTFSDKEALYSHINNTAGVCKGMNNHLFIIFLELDFFAEIHNRLRQFLNPLNYILIPCCSGSFDCLINLNGKSWDNLFDIIVLPLDKPGANLFLYRLDAEIASRNRIFFLQNEVKEFYDIGKSLSSEKDTIKLLDKIIVSSMSLTSSDAGTIYLIVDSVTGKWSYINKNACNDKLLKFAIAKNASKDVQLETAESPITNESISGYTVLTGNPVRIDDAYNLNPGLSYRHDKSYDASTGYITKSILSIPLKDNEGKVLGVIQLINKKKSPDVKLDFKNPGSLDSIIPFDYTDELIMSSLAGQAAVALSNNLLYRDMQQLLQDYRKQNQQLEILSNKILKAHEEERKRIAREIHDGPAQTIVNLSLKLELCRYLLKNGDTVRFNAAMDELNNSIKECSKELRTIIYNLRPSNLENGLFAALENYFSTFSDATGIDIKFKKSGSDANIKFYIVSTVFRIIQESLNNIRKHSGADSVKVAVDISSSDIRVTVSDNGKGFDVAAVEQEKRSKPDGGFGLSGMKERAELINGWVDIRSSPGKGTKIIINIPL